MRRIFEQKTLSAPRFRLRISQSGNGIGDVEGKVGQCFKVIGTWLWDAADHHVRVAAGLHLLQTVPGYQRIQRCRTRRQDRADRVAAERRRNHVARTTRQTGSFSYLGPAPPSDSDGEPPPF
jgi:hypothetical protein